MFDIVILNHLKSVFVLGINKSQKKKKTKTINQKKTYQEKKTGGTNICTKEKKFYFFHKKLPFLTEFKHFSLIVRGACSENVMFCFILFCLCFQKKKQKELKESWARWTACLQGQPITAVRLTLLRRSALYTTQLSRRYCAPNHFPVK